MKTPLKNRLKTQTLQEQLRQKQKQQHDENKIEYKTYALKQRKYRITAFTEATSIQGAFKIFKQFMILTPGEYIIEEHE